MHEETPEEWRGVVRRIVEDMGVNVVDTEALNLLSLIVQQETCKLLKSCVGEARAAGRSDVMASDASVACRTYETVSFVHPRFFEDNLRGLVDVINAQSIQADAFEDPQLCSNLNLSAPPWKLSLPTKPTSPGKTLDLQNIG